jgi:hypothetical protein
MKASFENSTIVSPVIDCSDFARKNINFHLENSDCNVVILYDEGNPEDYVINERVTYVKNQSGRHFPKILNQLIVNCPTEYVIYCNWRYRPTRENHQLAFDKLNEGYGAVDLSGPLQYTAFSKHLIGIIGFFDEKYIGGHCVDWDFLNNLFFYNIAHYNVDICYGDFSLATGENPTFTTWRGNCGNTENYSYFPKKWHKNGTELVRTLKEINFNDKHQYHNKFESRKYLPFSNSYIEVPWAKGQMDGLETRKDETSLSFII